MKNSERNTLQIKKIYDEFQAMKDTFSTEIPNKTRGVIKSLLKEINFFNKSPKPNDEVKEIII